MAGCDDLTAGGAPAGSTAWSPAPWFLATPPSSSPGMIARTDVHRILDLHVQQSRAVVVLAPSGFGKTVAVGQWAAAQRQHQPGSVGWLTVTEQAADFPELIRGIMTALRRAAGDGDDAQVRRALATAFELPSLGLVFTALSTIQIPGPVTVVLDDFQKAIGVTQSTEFVEFIEHGPPWLRLVLITTEAPEALLTRLRVHGQVAVVAAGELAFTAEDVLSAAGQVHQQGLAAGDAERIVQSTGGWPAAVRLALLDGEIPSALDDLDVSEYIRAAVLARLRPELAEFVLAATVCTRVDERLAGVLSGRADAAGLLAECATSGLFIERFGSGEDAIYQWHSMFAHGCGEVLRQSDPARWSALNLLAARELRDRYPLDAGEHAVRGADGPLAAEIITDHWLELLLEARSVALESACIAVADAFGETADIAMVRSCCREVAGDRLGAQLHFERAQDLAHGHVESRRVRLVANLSRILISDDHSTMAGAVDAVSEALTDRTLVPDRVYACTLFLVGWAETRLRRDVGHSMRLLESAAQECRALGLAAVADRATESLAFAYVHAGQFGRAQLSLSMAEVPWLSHEGGGISCFTTGFMQLWQGELAGALEDFTVVDAAVGEGYPDIGRMMLVFSAAALRNQGCDLSLPQLEAVAMRIGEGDNRAVPIGSFRAAALARIAEMRGHSHEALQLAARLVDVTPLPTASAMVAGICRRLGNADLAQTLADNARGESVATYTRAYAALIGALLAWERADNDRAHQLLEESLALAAPESVRYPFLDNADQSCRELLGAHSSRTAYPDFLAECLLACETGASENPAAALTSREREVLAYLRTPMTAAEIAAKLSVSVNTLKTHQRSIYQKLQVSNRREAIGIAPH
ncbi:LuxR C-terminal-related transcriptional regulator [Mycobacteroides chelonae]|uniref:LuxR C-terminal-related transcriptional regulator n=1 Tax=Mycobacteroides chelonae TaxID=1774 RepID=UPI0009BFB4B0|nr:LuxR C-terminal-related transcriptional regulator [Mycobacteroides chelonae]